MVKLFVVAHKPSMIPKSEVLVPIHVGRAVSRYKEEMAGMIGDDTHSLCSANFGSQCDGFVLDRVLKENKSCEENDIIGEKNVIFAKPFMWFIQKRDL